jgi:hypothetical protein
MVKLKEYRTLLPFTVEEYRIGQLYLTAKSSIKYSKPGEGVEVVINEPFDDERGKGQYTKKIFHLSELIPSWVKYLFSSLNGLQVIEESWNQYPDGHTIYHCDYFGKKFKVDVVTKHIDNDLGKIENIHNLSAEDLKIRTVDYIDIVNDELPAGKYKKEEDPKLFASKTRKMGPLQADWVKTTKPIMCAYKVVRATFSLPLISSKLEQAIQDKGFREILLEVNRQAFCWMDEWIWMKIEDLRKYEAECAQMQKKAIESSANNEEQAESKDNDDQ